VHPLVVHVALDHLDHGPFEEQLPRLPIAAQPALDLVAMRGGVEPEVAVAVGTERVAQTSLHRLHRPPSGEIPGGEALDLGLAARVVVPQLDTAPVLERHEEAADRGHPAEAVARKIELADHLLMQQPGDVGAGRHAHPGPRLLHGARAPHPVARLQHQHGPPGPRQVRGAGQPVVTGPDDDRVPPPPGEIGHGLRQADASEHGRGGTEARWCHGGLNLLMQGQGAEGRGTFPQPTPAPILPG
jgi:hypothetical protein